MWDEPYLESCCRSALHRLILAGETGRPPEPKDLPCLERLDGMGLALQRTDGRYRTTEAGRSRHEVEIQPREIQPQEIQSREIQPTGRVA